MNKGFLTRTWVLLTAIMVLSVGLNAGVITGNFCSDAPVDNPGFSGLGYEGQSVGHATGANQWFNDLTQTFNVAADPDEYTAQDDSTGAVSAVKPGTVGENLYYTDGSAAPDALTIAWDANRTGQDSNDLRQTTNPGGGGYQIDNRNEQMMAGFLMSQPNTTTGLSTITLTGTNMALAYGANPYSIYLYVDGENAAGEIGTWSAALTGGDTFYGTDVQDYINDSNVFTQVTSTTSGVYTAGNYVLFEDVVGDFEITLTGISSNVVLNGFEIVPEPSSFALLALLGCCGGLIRRRRSA